MPELCYTIGMATITLEVPDELAQRLDNVADELPEILATILDKERLNIPSHAFVTNQAWVEVIEFLARTPDVQKVLDFKLSDDLQERIEELLLLGNEGVQTSEEREELDGYVQVIHFFNLLKAQLHNNPV